MVIDYVFLETDTKFNAKDRYRPDVQNKNAQTARQIKPVKLACPEEKKYQRQSHDIQDTIKSTCQITGTHTHHNYEAAYSYIYEIFLQWTVFCLIGYIMRCFH